MTDKRYSYAMLRDDPMLALKVLLDAPINPDPMTQSIAHNNIKVSRQRLRAYLDELLCAKGDK